MKEGHAGSREFRPGQKEPDRRGRVTEGVKAGAAGLLLGKSKRLTAWSLATATPCRMYFVGGYDATDGWSMECTRAPSVLVPDDDDGVFGQPMSTEPNLNERVF